MVQSDRKVGNSGKNCDSGISLNSEQKEPASEEVSKFHFGQKFFILNWALAGAIERKKCKKLQFRSSGWERGEGGLRATEVTEKSEDLSRGKK